MTTQIQSLFGMLGSDSVNEAENAFRLLRKVMTREGAKFHHYELVPRDTGPAISRHKSDDATHALYEEIFSLEAEVASLRTEKNLAEGKIKVRDAEVRELQAKLQSNGQVLAELGAEIKRFQTLLRQEREEKQRLADRLALVRQAVLGEPQGAPKEEPEGEPSKVPPMGSEEFVFHAQRIAGEGRGWQSRIARRLNITSARVYHYKNGNATVPDEIAVQLRSMN